MSSAGSSSVVTTLLAVWFFLPIVQVPLLAECGSVDASKVQHSVATSTRHGDSKLQNRPVFDDDASKSFGMPELLLWRKHRMPVRSRSVVMPNLGRIRGRKMLFGTRGPCASQDMTLTQGPVSSTSGIPTFSVQIINLCGACAMGAIHVACGNWASATPVDPFVFDRIGYNDCLVNNGKPLGSQGSITFQYSNSAMYPMSISSAKNECS